MKKALKKTIEYLSRYIGKEIVRSKPQPIKSIINPPLLSLLITVMEGEGMVDKRDFKRVDWPVAFDYSFMVDSPIILLGFTPDGCIIYRNSPKDSFYDDLKDETKIMSLSYTDRNWITYKKAIRAKGNRLNAWKGRMVVRTTCNPISGSKSAMSSPVKLLWASRYGVAYQDELGLVNILNQSYANPNEWKLAE